MKPSVVLSLVFLAALFSQAGGTRTKGDNLYSLALFASVTEMEKSWGHIDDSDRGRIRTDYRHMVVEKDSEITDDLLSQSGDYNVEYLDDQALIARFKKLRKEFSVLKIRSVHNEGSRLKILISVYYFKVEKGGLVFEVSDWSDVEFQYDCEKQNYIISAVKLGGI